MIVLDERSKSKTVYSRIIDICSSLLIDGELGSSLKDIGNIIIIRLKSCKSFLNTRSLSYC